MALNASKVAYAASTSKFKAPEPMDVGTYPARLVQVLDLGVQEQAPWKGEPKPPAHEIMVTYEFVDEFMQDEDGNDIEDKPRWLSENFVLHNLGSELAKSTKRYVAIDPEQEHEGDWTKLGGYPVMVTVGQRKGQNQHAGKIFNNITATSACTKKQASKMDELKNPAKIFDQGDLSTVDIFFTLPQWLREKIEAGLDWEGSKMQIAVANYQGEKNEDVNQKQGAKKKAKPVEEDEDDEAPFDVDQKEAEGESDW